MHDKPLPLAVVHDHLDGGLRPLTMLELAETTGYTNLPARTAAALQAEMHQGGSKSLAKYLGAFDHTVALMQDASAIERVAYEAAMDHAAVGVVYAEIRFGPSLHTARGLTRQDATEAALAGLSRAEADSGIVAPLISAGLRQQSDSCDVAESMRPFLGQGLVAFDMAGPEIGHPASDHAAACRIALDAGFHVTLHAGEAVGPQSILEALKDCGSERLGHGVRIIEDCRVLDGEVVDLGPIAQDVYDRRIPLEICPTSNLHTGVSDSIDNHPFGLLMHAGFAVTINTDNRLMSGVSVASEMALCTETFDLTLDDRERIVAATVAAGFADENLRHTIINDKIRPSYAAARAAGS